jgi:PBSX family phage portal protein
MSDVVDLTSIAEKKKEMPVTKSSARMTMIKRSDTSRQLDTIDEFTQSSTFNSTYINPPYSPAFLADMFEQSNMLPQSVAAYITNVAMYGWEIVQASPDTEVDEQEKEELQSFIDRSNAEESLTTIHAKLVHDYEKFGFAFLEFIRDSSKRVSVIRHIRSMTVRLCPKNKEKVAISYDIARGSRVSTTTELKKFRTYLQLLNGESVYFKEFGDPRRLNYKTGKFEDKEYKVADEDLATELLHFRQMSEDAYGTPRWISQLPSILGSREAEESNWGYFKDNTVPPLMIVVSGGRLTKQSYNDLQKQLSTESIGKDRQNKIMLVEAVPERESFDDKGSVSLKLEKLTDSRQNDSLFSDYDKSNQGKIMSSFRLSPILVGKGDQHTFATSNVSQFVAETQVFSVMRTFFDEIYNNRIVASKEGLNLKTVLLKSKSPTITDPETLIKSLTALNVMGAVTPRSAISSANRILQISLPQYPENGEDGYEPWMDKPIVLETAGIKKQTDQAVKSPADKALEATGNLNPPPKHGQE